MTNICLRLVHELDFSSCWNLFKFMKRNNAMNFQALTEEANISCKYKAFLGHITTFTARTTGQQLWSCPQLVMKEAFVEDWCVNLITIKTHLIARRNETQGSREKRVYRVVKEWENLHRSSGTGQERLACGMFSEGQIALFSQKGMFWKKNRKMKETD